MFSLSTRDHLLTRHFLQRFLDNDLISPHADRHEIVAVVCAAFVTSGLFVTVLLSVKFLFQTFQSPGRTAVPALDDRFFYIAASMIVMALVAVATWDGLALDGRDTSVLGTLPISQGVIVRAKVTAVALFAIGLDLTLNLAPSVLHPLLMAAKLPLGLIGTIQLILVHAGVTMLAGAFGFLAVLALREVLQALLSAVWFSRVSTVVQALVVVGLAIALLLLPGGSSHITRSWLAADAANPFAVPALWFVGLFETLAGGTIDRLPRLGLPPRVLSAENAATVLYRSYADLFQQLALFAATALGLVTLVAIAASAWNARRLPMLPMARRAGRHWLSASLKWAATRIVVRRPVAQAGFFFTLQSLSRSVPHRLSMATSVAVGLAAATATLRGVDVREALDPWSIPLALLAVQAVLLIAPIVGFRHAVSVPAELRGNWTFHLSWCGDERAYLNGVKRAALIGFVLPTLIALLPLHAFMLGARLAVAHLAFGLLLAVIALDILLLGFRRLPFASSYVPSGNLRSMAPIYLLMLLCVIYGVASIERLTLTSSRDTAVLFAAMVAILVIARVVDSWQRRTPAMSFDLDELPSADTQRLDLSG